MFNPVLVNDGVVAFSLGSVSDIVEGDIVVVESLTVSALKK